MAITVPAAAAGPASGDDARHLPLPAIAAALVAFGALYVTASGLSLLPVLAAALLATHFFGARLPRQPAALWVARILLAGLVFLANPQEPANADYLMGSARFRNIFGLLFASELVLHAWRRHPDRGALLLPVLLHSGMVFLTACNTFETGYIRYFAPAYTFLVAVSLRHYRVRGGAAAGRAGWFWAGGLRGLLVVLGLGLGFGGYVAFWTWRGEITEIGSRLLGERRWPEGRGMAAQPTLGPTFGLRGSAARVLRVEDFSGVGHLRGMAFDLYRSGRWGPVVGQRRFDPPGPLDLQSRGMASLTGLSDMRITRLDAGTRLLFAPLNTAALDQGEADDLEWSPSTGAALRSSIRPPYTYRVTVPENERHQGPLARAVTPEERERCLVVPESLDPRVRGLAHRIGGTRVGAEERIEAVVTYLMANHAYSLRTDPGDGDPVSNFLLQDKDAHCEFFASAAALLLRCLGVPARYVTGYYAHESGGPGVAIVRQRDAHAWAEAWVDGVGWVVVDATPGDGRPDHEPDRIPVWQAFWEWLQDRLQSLRDWLGGLTGRQFGLAVAGVGLVLAFGAAWPLLRQRARRGGDGEFAYAAAEAELASLALRFENVFRRQGAAFPPGRTWQEHLGSLERDGPLGAPAGEFVRAYNRARLGAPDDRSDALAGLRRLMDQMEKTSAER
uniref:Transglutaminase-like domain-containing protein n=1 Tax=uncultured Armatimonadetes bacterium TaxID=157466 RepID=A0A6J4JBD6_9BACT|nr:hypothetical protein AVDCRST_MAG63-3184 [uncultured Armatimonadetes bacterium]